ncbi:hypothetical protein L1887_28979 [Cichorium endivia]|nr:hypothetical protein L1887_28979 [Cichorium endivia]
MKDGQVYLPIYPCVKAHHRPPLTIWVNSDECRECSVLKTSWSDAVFGLFKVHSLFSLEFLVLVISCVLTYGYGYGYERLIDDGIQCVICNLFDAGMTLIDNALSIFTEADAFAFLKADNDGDYNEPDADRNGVVDYKEFQDQLACGDWSCLVNIILVIICWNLSGGLAAFSVLLEKNGTSGELGLYVVFLVNRRVLPDIKMLSIMFVDFFHVLVELQVAIAVKEAFVSDFSGSHCARNLTNCTLLLSEGGELLDCIISKFINYYLHVLLLHEFEYGNKMAVMFNVKVLGYGVAKQGWKVKPYSNLLSLLPQTRNRTAKHLDTFLRLPSSAPLPVLPLSPATVGPVSAFASGRRRTQPREATIIHNVAVLLEATCLCLSHEFQQKRFSYVINEGKIPGIGI